MRGNQLWKMQYNYMVKCGSAGGRVLPIEHGGAFWLHLSRVNPPLIDETLRDLYMCPVEGRRNTGGTTDYRGPNGNANVFGDGDPVSADKVDNHGSGEGGNVLRKSGDVQTVPESDRLWTLAGTKTCP